MCREPAAVTLDAGHPEPAPVNPGLEAVGAHTVREA